MNHESQWKELRIEILDYFKIHWPAFINYEMSPSENVGEATTQNFSVNGHLFPRQPGDYFRNDPFAMMRVPGDFIDPDEAVRKFCVVTKIRSKDLGAMVYWVLVNESEGVFHQWIKHYRSLYIKDLALNNKIKEIFELTKKR